MKLHENKQLFRQSVQFTAQQMNIPNIYVEKDYWVMYVLKTIFNDPIGEETIFKGGTSLSKCFNLIGRFSEDIDLVVIRREGELNNQLTNKIRKISRLVADAMPEVHINGVTQKMGMNRKTAHSYEKEFQGNYGQVRDVIIVEATWLGYFEPYATKTISSFIYEMMLKTSQQAMAEEYELLPFDVLVLDPKRTLCEKIMSLVRFSYSEEPIEELKKKIRHTYDLNQLLQNSELFNFLNSKAFEEMLLKVANDDTVSYRNNNNWLQYHPNNAKIFTDVKEVWNVLKVTYNGDFRKLVFGDFPKDEKILETLLSIKNRLALIEWVINFDNKS
jgi:hypothetical protein